MRGALFAVLLASLLPATVAKAEQQPVVPDWLVGSWTAVELLPFNNASRADAAEDRRAWKTSRIPEDTTFQVTPSVIDWQDGVFGNSVSTDLHVTEQTGNARLMTHADSVCCGLEGHGFSLNRNASRVTLSSTRCFGTDDPAHKQPFTNCLTLDVLRLDGIRGVYMILPPFHGLLRLVRNGPPSLPVPSVPRREASAEPVR